MPTLDGLAEVISFLERQTPKIAAQVSKKVFGLGVDPRPHDSRELRGYPGYRRLDSGEYRIVYRISGRDDVVTVVLIGKRNDDAVYEKLRRLLK
jgi:mRNA interferase RelE/StbE